MKGYYTVGNYMGWIPSKRRYMRFETKAAYEEYYMELEA